MHRLAYARGRKRGRGHVQGAERRGAAGSQALPEVRRGSWRAFVFCLLPFALCWLYILRLFRLFRFFSISLSAARHFFKIGGNFAVCWRCASNQAERIAKKQAEHLLRLLFYRCFRFVFLSVYIPRHRLDKKIYMLIIIIYPPTLRATRQSLRAAAHMRRGYIWAEYIFYSYH